MVDSDTNSINSGFARRNSTQVAVSSRHDSSSSHSSDAYAPLPSGRWILKLHGKCVRCHHHHSSAKFRVNVPHNPSITTHLRCKACNEKWISIGGRNVTQLSSLSIESERPDAVVANDRYPVTDMVRSTATLAALPPVLAEVAGSASSPGPSRPRPLHSHQVQCPSRPSLFEIYEDLQLEPVVGLRSPTARPTGSQKDSFVTRKRIARLKESLGMRVPALHRANLRSRFPILNQPRMSAKRRGKQPTRTPMTHENATDPSVSPDEDYGDRYSSNIQSEGSLIPMFGSTRRLYASMDAAMDFLQTIANDTTQLDSMNEKQRAAWIRARYTEFRYQNGRAGSTLQDCRDLELDGIGSHLGVLEEFSLSDSSLRASSCSFSERVSEADTAIEDAVAAALRAPHYPPVEFTHHERRDSGSRRQQSRTAYTRQRLRQRWPRIRPSIDSEPTTDAARSPSRPRSAVTDHYSHNGTHSSMQLTESQVSH